MLAFMKLGGRKAIADINIEMSGINSQNLYYNGQHPTQFGFSQNPIPNNRAIIVGATDRPSASRMISLNLVALPESAINCLSWPIYSSSTKYYGAIPMFYKKSSLSGGKKRKITFRKYKKPIKYKSLKKSSKKFNRKKLTKKYKKMNNKRYSR
jgi:hypothetical protein